MTRPTRHWVAPALLVASTFVTTFEAVCLRWLGGDVSQAQVLLFRSGMQLVLVAVVGAWMLGRFGRLVQTTRLRAHLLRGCLAAVAWWCYYMSFKNRRAADRGQQCGDGGLCGAQGPADRPLSIAGASARAVPRNRVVRQAQARFRQWMQDT